MPEFLAETYAPRGTAAPGAADVADVAWAGQASQDGAPVRLLGAILVPEEETCFWLYQAPSAAAVRAAMTRARLQPERITPAVPVRPPRPVLARPARPAAESAPGPHRTSPCPPGTGPP
ncbi:MAG TPA: hypothetical protein VNA11_20760 [Pseudonocardia sp.]|nr:hypothetical protein [Pseudonocardia sp.]